MADKYLRHIPTGTIYIWQPAYAQRADFEEYVPEPAPAPAPDPEVAAEPVAVKPRTTRKKAVEPAPEPTPEPVVVDEEALSADASRNLP